MQMTPPGLLRTFGDMGMGGVREEDNLKIDGVLPDKLKKADTHFKRLEDKSVLGVREDKHSGPLLAEVLIG